MRLEDFERLASLYGVDLDEVLLLALNLHGIWSTLPRHRARLRLRVATVQATPWLVIVPLNRSRSPFRLDGETVRAGCGAPVATVTRVEADDAVGGYFRDQGRALTLNPNARSRCTGCAFCPNTLEAAADPRLTHDPGLAGLLRALTSMHPAGELAGVREVTVSTGCFEREPLAVDHVVRLRRALTRSGVDVRARVGLLTSVVRARAAFEQLAEWAAPFVLRLTVECFTRRELLLKHSKATLAVEAMPGLLEQACAAGLGTSCNVIVGLDSLDDLVAGIHQLLPRMSEFPNLQVFQAHTPLMDALRAEGADQLGFYLEARQRLEALLAPTGLRPAGWENYRPLWYTAFAGSPLDVADAPE